MYAWIWRHLPFGLPGKITGSLVLVGATVALLWFWVFPATAGWVEEFLLPFDQSTIDGPGSGPGAGTSGGSDPGFVDGDASPEPTPADPHDIPYDTDE